MPQSVKFNGRAFVANVPSGLGYGVPTAQVSSGLVAAVGDILYLEAASNTFKKTGNTSAAVNAVDAIVVAATGSVLPSGIAFTVMRTPCTVPLKTFGTLTALQALGANKEAYVTAGRISNIDGTSAHFNNKLFTLPKTFVSLTQADYDTLLVTVQPSAPVSN